jgi:glucokinase
MAPRKVHPPALYAGIDIGATKVLCGLVDARGRVVVRSDRRVHRNDGPKGVVAAVLDELASFGPALRSVVGAGVAVAGQVDARRGVVLYAPNLRWRNEPLGPRLAHELHVPVTLENDVRAATWGEWKHGGARGVDNLVCVYVGTGVGGGLVVDGHLLRGAVGAAGEIGHLTVVAGGRKCTCPNRGCLEAYVAGWAIAERAREAIRAAPEEGEALVQRAGSARRVDAATVTAAARDGDPLSVGLMQETGRILGAGAVGLVNSLNPDRLLLGGGMLEGWPDLVRQVREAVRWGAQPPAARAVRVARARLGPMASVVGAAWIARAAAQRRDG